LTMALRCIVAATRTRDGGARRVIRAEPPVGDPGVRLETSKGSRHGLNRQAHHDHERDEKRQNTKNLSMSTIGSLGIFAPASRDPDGRVPSRLTGG
jgi:hypothetical protein